MATNQSLHLQSVLLLLSSAIITAEGCSEGTIQVCGCWSTCTVCGVCLCLTSAVETKKISLGVSFDVYVFVFIFFIFFYTMYFVLKFSQLLPTFLPTQFHVLVKQANRTKVQSYAWWLILLVPGLGKQTQADLWGWDQPSVHHKFQGPGGRMWSSKEGGNRIQLCFCVSVRRGLLCSPSYPGTRVQAGI